MTDSHNDLVDQLGKLASLRDSGALSEAEFEVAKAKVLCTSPTETAKSAPRTGGSAVGPAVQAAEDNNLKPAVEEGVWNCTGCGKVNGVARAKCWVCGGTRDGAQARPWEKADGPVIGLVSTPWDKRSPPASIAITEGFPDNAYRSPPRRLPDRKNNYKGWLLVGIFALGFWALLYLVPGIVFQGSVQQVQADCSDPLVQSAMPSGSCSLASGLGWVIWPLLGIAVSALIRGTYRWYHASQS